MQNNFYRIGKNTNLGKNHSLRKMRCCSRSVTEIWTRNEAQMRSKLENR